MLKLLIVMATSHNTTALVKKDYFYLLVSWLPDCNYPLFCVDESELKTHSKSTFTLKK